MVDGRRHARRGVAASGAALRVSERRSYAFSRKPARGSSISRAVDACVRSDYARDLRAERASWPATQTPMITRTSTLTRRRGQAHFQARMPLTERLTVSVVLSLCPIGFAPCARAQFSEEQKIACADGAEHGQRDRDEGRLLEARRELLACASEACPSIVRTSCAQWLNELDPRIPSIVLRVVDAEDRDVAGATVQVDGAAVTLDGRPVPLDPGQHRIVVVVPERAPATEYGLLAVEGENARLVRIELPAAPAHGTCAANSCRARDHVCRASRPPLPGADRGLDPGRRRGLVIGCICISRCRCPVRSLCPRTGLLTILQIGTDTARPRQSTRC
jgi:hypothetical protein